MQPCLYCVEKHIGKAKVYFGEAQAGYPGRIGMCIGELAAAEEESDNPLLQTKLRAFRKNVETHRQHTRLLWEELLSDVDAMIQESHVPAKTPGGCASCEEKRKAREAAQRHLPSPAPAAMPIPIPDANAPHLILLTALGDFTPSYSLTSVIADQARAGTMAGFRVTVVGMEHLSKHTPNIPGVEFKPLIPNVGWVEDEVDEAKTQQISQALLGYLGGHEATVITHDLVFQSWYINIARAIHQLAGHEDLVDIRWFHQVHSSVGPRPDRKFAQWRAKVPTGHKMVAVNWSDIPHLTTYYQSQIDEWVTIPNSCDPRSFGTCHPIAADLYDQMTGVDVVQVYPLSTPRARAKGLQTVIRTLGAVTQDHGLSSALIVANAHANGPDANQIMAEMDAEAQRVGVRLIWTSRDIPGTEATGLPREAIADLQRLANVFVFPSSSESCGLVALEAAVAGNLLVLNKSLHTLTDYITHKAARWVRFGSIREPLTDDSQAVAEAAQIIANEVQTNPVLTLRARLQRVCSLEALKQVLRGLVLDEDEHAEGV